MTGSLHVMGLGNKLLCTGLLLAALSPAAALPPPVGLQVTVLTVEEPPETAELTERLIGTLVAENWISGPAPTKAGEAFQPCLALKDEARHACLSEALRKQAKAGPDGDPVLMLIEHPGWRGAQHQVTCIGADPAKAKVEELHLRDAFHARTDIAGGVRRGAASCVIGAIHGPAAAR